MEESKGSVSLERDVFDKGLCTSCGACVGLCPYIQVVKDKVAVIEHCRISEGQCYDFCPRTHTDIQDPNERVFAEERKDFFHLI